jgi:uncharacterized Tic20 family protein
MTENVVESIAPQDRALAAWTHLSGLAGYVIPFGGVLVPVVIWVAKSESPVISAIAKQALLLNVVAFLAGIVLVLSCLTIILIPVAIVLGIALAVAAVALPIVGAVRAYDGIYYNYPLVGVAPR